MIDDSIILQGDLNIAIDKYITRNKKYPTGITASYMNAVRMSLMTNGMQREDKVVVVTPIGMLPVTVGTHSETDSWELF